MSTQSNAITESRVEAVVVAPAAIPPTRLLFDIAPKEETPNLVAQFAEVFTSFEPDEVFVPHHADVHSDHRLVFEAAVACTKWFRHPSVRRVLAYETLSETDFNLDAASAFHPTTFVDIGGFLDRKLELLNIYRSEIEAFPFPRSIEAIRALAMMRGATSGFAAAEAFQLLRERQ